MKCLRHVLIAAVALLLASADASAQSVRPPDNAVTALPPVHLLPEGSESDFWRAIRQGEAGKVTLPNAQAGLMIQSEGSQWQQLRNGPYMEWSAYILFGMIGLLALFFVVRGKVRISKGWSNQTVTRFNGIERFAHWITAVSFIILGITGLNLIFGRLAIPWLDSVLGNGTGKSIFASVTMYGKLAHNTVGFAFIVGIILMFVLWVWHNIPNRHDLVWLAKGGGLFGNTHPPAKKFNAGQKVIFWSVILGGGSLAVSGVALLYPNQFNLFSGTFVLANQWFGMDLPTALKPIQEMQLTTLWHGIIGVVMIAIILAHIYIGSVGMQGAFAAMGSGEVDRNWATDHHSLWVEEIDSGKNLKTPVE